MKIFAKLRRVGHWLVEPSSFPYRVTRVRRETPPLIDRFIHDYELKVERVFHIGANNGHETAIYSQRGVEGYFFEAIPSVYEILAANCAAYPDQHAIKTCLSDEAGEIDFNVSSNQGLSSSMLELGEHAEVFPDVTYVEKIRVPTEKLDDVVADGRVPADVDVAILDVQGAELKVLKGAKTFLASPRLRGLCLEASAADLYVGGARLADLMTFLEALGFFLRDVSMNRDGFGDAFFLNRWW